MSVGSLRNSSCPSALRLFFSGICDGAHEASVATSWPGRALWSRFTYLFDAQEEMTASSIKRDAAAILIPAKPPRRRGNPVK